MRKITFGILFVAALGLVGCSGNDNKQPEKPPFYYLLITDYDEATHDAATIANDVIKAESDSAAFMEAIIIAHARLLGEASLATSLSSSWAQLKPHEFSISVYDINGLIYPSEDFINKHVEHLSTSSQWWNDNKGLREALKYYKENTNQFKSPMEMFAGEEDDPEILRIVKEKIKSEAEKAQAAAKNESGNNSIVIMAIVVFCIIYLFLAFARHNTKHSKPKNNHSEQKTQKATDNGPGQETKRYKLKNPRIKMLDRKGDPYEDEWHTYIAGAKYRASKYDVGGFWGWVRNDSENAHDNKAMGIYKHSGKLMGYIPADDLADYWDWSGGEVMPCVGFIFEDDDIYRGKVKILHPCNQEFLQTEFSSYLQWVHDNYGKEYLPKDLSVEFDIE